MAESRFLDGTAGAALAILAGAALWIGIALAGGRVEAWDSPLYFQLGLPLVLLLAAFLGWHAPRRPWRWGLALMAGQWAALAATTPPGGLWPLGLAAFLVLALPCMAAASLAARLRRARP